MVSDRAQDNTASLVSESPSDTVFDSVRVGPSNVSKDSEIFKMKSDFPKDFWRALLLHRPLAKSRVLFALRSLQNNLVLRI